MNKSLIRGACVKVTPSSQYLQCGQAQPDDWPAPLRALSATRLFSTIAHSCHREHTMQWREYFLLGIHVAAKAHDLDDGIKVSNLRTLPRLNALTRLTLDLQFRLAANSEYALPERIDKLRS